MYSVGSIRKFRRWLYYIAAALVMLFFFFLIFADQVVEPILRKRMHTLIIKGSDSLYKYTLGKLKANFFGGSVEVENLQIFLDSNHYENLRKQNALPSITMEFSLEKGHIKGIGFFSLLFGKKIRIEEVMSQKANVRLLRHIHQNNKFKPETDLPLWKSLQPQIEGIYIDRIKLDGVRFVFLNADTSESVRLNFDQCDALLEDIRIDSASSFDTTRMGFAKSVFMRLNDLHYITRDSTYKLNASRVTYSSQDRLIEIDSFLLQPTLLKDTFYKKFPIQQSLYNVSIHNARFKNIALEHFIHHNSIEADSLIIERPVINIYNDKTMPPDFESKIGKYPQQKLLKAAAIVNIKNIVVKNADAVYTEKNQETLKEGELSFHGLHMLSHNVTNAPEALKTNAVCTSFIRGKILRNSPFEITFLMRLDSSNGKYKAFGFVKNVATPELNELSMAFSNIQINSFNIHELGFTVNAEDYDASSNVRLRYNDLSITMLKKAEKTGVVHQQKFLTRIFNKHVLHPHNPMPGGVERTGKVSEVYRLTSHSFFGFLWKAILAGMHDIIMQSN